jgi:2,4'-dihydroxyacetophenone dioxygenase
MDSLRINEAGGISSPTLLWKTVHTLVIADDSPEPALIFFVVEGGLIYLDNAVDGGFVAYEGGFSALELARRHYREIGLDVRKLDALVR